MSVVPAPRRVFSLLAFVCAWCVLVPALVPEATAATCSATNPTPSSIPVNSGDTPVTVDVTGFDPSSTQAFLEASNPPLTAVLSVTFINPGKIQVTVPSNALTIPRFLALILFSPTCGTDSVPLQVVSPPVVQFPVSTLGLPDRINPYYAVDLNTGRHATGNSGQGWSSCSGCHLDGLTDKVAWQFSEGPRQTISVPSNNRILNWSAIFWEPKDQQQRSAGPISGVTVDPSDPSGNTVYVAGASGSVWMTTNFLTTSPKGPSYVQINHHVYVTGNHAAASNNAASLVGLDYLALAPTHAGTIALLRQPHPDWSVDELKALTASEQLRSQLVTVKLPYSAMSSPAPYAYGNTANGNQVIVIPSITLRGLGANDPLQFRITCNSQGNNSGPEGGNCIDNFDMAVFRNGTSATVENEDGRMDLFDCTNPSDCKAQGPGNFNHLGFNNIDGSATLTAPDGVRVGFNALGSEASIIDPRGHMVTITRDAQDRKTMVSDNFGMQFQFNYNADNLLQNITDPQLNRNAIFGYDTNRNLNSYTDPAGSVWRFIRNSNGGFAKITDPNNNAVTFTFNTNNQVDSSTDAMGGKISFTYNADGLHSSMTDQASNAYNYTNDSLFHFNSATNPLGGITRVTYGANGIVDTLKDPLNNTFLIQSDNNGNVLQETDPFGNTETSTYDANNNRTSYTDERGFTETNEYDANDRLIKTTDPLGGSWSHAYDTLGRETSQTDPRGVQVSLSYDAVNGTIAETIADGTYLYEYDRAGRVLQARNPLGQTTTFAYNVLDRITGVTDPLGNAIQLAYDANQNATSITDANANVTKNAYDARNLLVMTTDALSGVTKFQYDANGNLLSQTDAAGHATSYAYDALNRRTKFTDALGNTNQFTYDAVSNVTKFVDGNGNANQYTYDALNRQTSATLFDGSSIGYTYDAKGNVLSMADSRGLNTYSYDVLNRVVSAATPDGAIVRFGYDAVGNRISLTLPSGKVNTYGYDALNRMTQADGPTTYTYDAAGRLISMAMPNGTSTAFRYDAAGRLTQVINSFGLKVLSGFTYSLDALGNRTQVTSAAGGVTRYAYDALGRLTSWTAPSGQTTAYTYDAVGNRTSVITPLGITNYAYDADNRMTGAGAAILTYDHNGNLMNDGTFVYGYDALNRLVSVAGGTVNSRYSYDGFNRRVRQQVPAGIYQYVNDPITGRVLTEAGPDGNLSYFYGLGRISVSGGATPLFYQYDGIGNVVTVTDNLGSVKQNYNYDPWGKFIGAFDALGTKNKYKFAGEAADPGTGLTYMRGRYYNPKTGRFISPGGLLGGNPYVYQGSNPVQ